MTISLFKLFFVFFYIGLVTIGGGLVGITVMEQVLVQKYALISQDFFYNMVAISESTPGPIGINMATYIGTELFGPLGGVITTAGQVLPSLIIIMMIAKFLTKFHEAQIVQDAFALLKPATTGLIFVAATNVFLLALVNLPAKGDAIILKNLFNFKQMIFYALALVILAKTKFHPIFIVALGAIFGVIFC